MSSGGLLRARAFEIAIVAILLLAACGSEKPAAPLPDNSAAVAGLAAGSVTKKPESAGLAAGSTLTVQLVEVLDSSDPSFSPFVVARIPDDVTGADGKLAFQAGSTVLLQVRRAGKQKDTSVLDLAVYSITAGGRQVRFVDGVKDLATATYTEEASAGQAHRSVHLSEDTLIPFKLQAAVSLK